VAHLSRENRLGWPILCVSCQGWASGLLAAGAPHPFAKRPEGMGHPPSAERDLGANLGRISHPQLMLQFCPHGLEPVRVPGRFDSPSHRTGSAA
jgi:hypothetical protein